MNTTSLSTPAHGRNRKLQQAAIDAYRARVREIVRELVPAGRRDEGEQVAALGVLVALEHFRFDRGPSLDQAVDTAVRSELARWTAKVVSK